MTPATSPGPRGPYWGKRLMDLALLAVVGAPALVLGAGCAIAVRLSSRGPVMFRQDRVGLNGEIIVVRKFRTMLDGDNPIIPDDDRITKVGRVLRRTSLDELPQLINVAHGDMSMVGPRPTLEYQVTRWTARQRGRLDVRPGLTGLAQISGRNDLSWDERIEFDLEYVASQSVRTDLRILSHTLTAIAGGEGTGATSADDPIAMIP
jgi:lipopolysaccharide/colanic/teichoic acid biosynthesis glycosyltransferase